jgi:hypothetical protein
MNMKKSLHAPSCGQCAHCVPIPDTTEGTCRRHPPIPMMKVDGNAVSAFPQVRLADIWCGDFVRQEKARSAK